MKRKKERSKAVTFPRKNELPQVGLEPTTHYMYTYTPHSYNNLSLGTCIIHVLMRDEEEGRKKEASKVKQTTRQSNTSTPKAVTFSKKNELPRVGLKPMTLYTLDMYILVACILLVKW